MPQAATPLIPFHAEHIIARQHLQDDHPDGLALACDRCNAYKGPNLASIDPQSGLVMALFHPRRHRWEEHFRIDGGMIVGLTPTGRATVQLLNMNARRRVQLRVEWIAEHGAL
jgi:hypothetical protein